MREVPDICRKSRQISSRTKGEKPVYLQDAEQYSSKKSSQIVKNNICKLKREMEEVTGKPDIQTR